MSGRRTPRYPMLKGYLMARPRPSVARKDDWPMPALGALGALGVFVAAAAGSWLLVAAVLFVVAFVGRALVRRKAAPPTPEQELAREADAVARKIDHQSEFNRLHRTLHPAVAATLEECAGYHERVVAALDAGDWSTRGDLRESALTAAKVAMDEALVLAGKTLAYAPETRPLDAVSDVLEDVGFGPLMRERVVDPVPPAFYPARDLAERLRELAVRCETAARQRREESPEPARAAFRHLDAALGEMRRLEEAETELRQGA